MALLALAVVGWNGCGSSAEPVEPVTNAETAIVEAKAGFASVYSKTHHPSLAPKKVAQFEPYTATLTNGDWYVRGTVPVGFRGLMPEAKVRASDAFTQVENVQVEGPGKTVRRPQPQHSAEPASPPFSGLRYAVFAVALSLLVSVVTIAFNPGGYLSWFLS